MLELDLIRERPALAPEFQASLAADLVSAMSLVLDSPTIEGLDQWVYTTHSALSEELRVEMAAVLIIGTKSAVYYGWLNELPRDALAHRDFAAFISWLNSFSVEAFTALLDGFLKMLTEHCARKVEGGPIDPTDPAAIMRACYNEILDEPQIGRLVQLLQSPADFKAQAIAVITHFWEHFYRRDFERALPIMDRSVAYHRQKRYIGDLPEVFVEVTGRRFPKEYSEDYATEHVIFVPSCHIGPYVMLSPCDEKGATMIIHYNARPAGAVESREIDAVQELFPPLKALADETRLQILALLHGRELYAQEIVDQLDISQSAVSRHLALMVAGGLLDVRREESMKYYTISESTLAALADNLKRFRAP